MICTYITICVCVYIYIYIYFYDTPADRPQPPILGAKYYTPEIIRGKFGLKHPLEIHRTKPVKIHWSSDNPLERTTDTCNSVWKYH